jgi:2-aminoethylphosphonate-pyruvate transaminase
MISSALPEERKLLVVNNGVYGERMLRMAEAHRIPTVELRYDWAARPDLNQIAERLKTDPAISAVALVHHETTTGLLNLVAEVGEITRRAGRLLLLDAVSALGGEELDLVRDGVDLCACTANKCVQGLPGVAFVLVRNEIMAAMQDYPSRSLYLHLPVHWQAHERRSIPFTPSVQAWYALDAALDELLEETVAARVQRYRTAAAFLREGFARMGLKFLLPPAYHANSLTSLLLPEGMTYQYLHDGLKERGFVIYEGQGKLQTGIFRVANMGHLTLEDFRRFLGALQEVLS